MSDGLPINEIITGEKPARRCTMSRKTDAETRKQIEALKAAYQHVRPYSAFGDDNLAQLDAQIQVLEEGMDDDDVHNTWDMDDDYTLWSAADTARKWLDNDSDCDVENLADGLPLL